MSKPDRPPSPVRLQALRTAMIVFLALGAAWTALRLPDDVRDPGPPAAPELGPSGFRIDNEHLYHLGAFLRPTLEANRKELEGILGRISGFGAGEVYPQIWIRDSATLLPAARYYFGRASLTTWLEEHLAHQRANGALYDWIAAGPPSAFDRYAPGARRIYASESPLRDDTEISADKNTVEADQESSAVLAADEAYQATGDRDWLERDILGVPLIERLDRALGYVLEERFDHVRGLVTNGLSADWGDVSPVYPDQRAIYLDDRTPRVVGLYTNTLFFHAAERLAALHQELSHDARAEAWRQTAAEIKDAIQRHLWQEEKGFYRMHLLVRRQGFSWVDDADILALGSNALAILYGIADDRRARRIFDEVERRRRELGLSTVSGVLLPPYPRGLFEHPLLEKRFVYQNGGQWDWFGGRYVLAEFERGYSERARRHLRQIAKKSVLAGGLYEWHTKQGKGRGSPHYAATAGALGAACFRGLFGVDWRAEGLGLNVRLGPWSGEIDLRQPANGAFVTYEYRYDRNRQMARLWYHASVPGEGEVRVLIPGGHTVETVTRDGNEWPHALERVGEDRYVRLSTDWGRHQIRIELE